MISEKVPEFKQFPYELYASAMLMAQSRSLQVPIKGQMTKCLIPFSDWAEHDEDNFMIKNTFNDKDELVIVQATKGIAKGDQIFSKYA